MADNYFTDDEIKRLKERGISDTVLKQLNIGKPLGRMEGNLDSDLMVPAIEGGFKPTLDSTSFGENVGNFASRAVDATKKLGNNIVGSIDAATFDNRGLLEANRKNAKIDQDRFNSLNPNELKASQDPAEFGKNYLFKGAGVAGDLAPAIAATVGAAVTGGALAPVAGLAGGTGATLGAIGAGATISGTDMASMVFNEKYNKLKESGYSEEEAISGANKAAGTAGLEAGVVGGIQNGLGFIAGTNVATKAVNALAPKSALTARAVGALTGGGVDASTNAIVAGPVNETIRSSAVGEEFDTSRAKEGAKYGALVGSAIGGVFGQSAGKRVFTDIEHTRENYGNHEVESGLLTEEGAKRRAQFLSNKNNTEYEVLPSINAAAETNGNRFVVAKRVKEQADGSPDNMLEFRKAEAERIANLPKEEVKPVSEETNTPKVADSIDSIIEQSRQNAVKQEEANNPLQAAAEIVRGKEEVKTVSDKIDNPLEAIKPLEEAANPTVKTEDITSAPKAEDFSPIINSTEPNLKEINAHNSKHYYGSGKNGNFEVKFTNDLDRALYVVSQSVKSGEANKSARHDNFVSFLQKHTGMSVDDISRLGLKMRETISNNIKNKNNVNEIDGKKSVNVSESFVKDFMAARDKIADTVAPKINETQNTESGVIKDIATIKNDEVKIPSLKDKVSKRNYGLDTDTQVLTDKDGNVSGFEYKATIARPNEFGKGSGGKDHLGVDIKSLAEVFDQGYKEVTLVREPNNPADSNAIRIMSDDKLLGYIPNQKLSGFMADKLAKYMDDGSLKSTYAEIHAEKVPYSARKSESSDNFVFSKGDTGKETAYRPIIEVKSSVVDTANAKDLITRKTSEETTSKQVDETISDKTPEQSVKNIEDNVITKPKEEDVAEVFKNKESAQKLVTDEFSTVAKELESLFKVFKGDFDFMVRSGKDLYNTKGEGENSAEIRRIVEENDGKSSGFYVFDETTGKSTAVVDLVSIAKQMNDPKSALSSFENIQDAAKFVLFHEAMGHGGINKFFKSPEERVQFLNESYNNSKIVRDIAEVKSELGYDKNDVAGLTEEVLADIAAGKIQIKDAEGNYKYQDIREFLSKYKDDVPALQSLVNTIKELFNKVFGRELASKADEVRTFEQLVDEMASISDSVKDSPYVKAKYDYLTNENISQGQKDLTVKFANNPNNIYDPDLSASKGETFKAYLSTLIPSLTEKQRVSYFKSSDYLAAKDPIYKVGHNMIRAKDMTSTRVENMMTAHVRLLKFLGKEAGFYDKVFNEQVKTGKKLTEAELTSRNIPSNAKLAYIKMNEALATQTELLAKSKMVEYAFNKELITRDEHLNLSKIENYSMDELAQAIKKQALDKFSAGRVDKDMVDIFSTRDLANQDIKSGRIERISTGDLHLVVRDKATNKMVDLKMYSNKFERQKDIRTITKKYGDSVEITRGSVPKDSRVLADFESNFKKLLKEAEENKIPFDVTKTIEKSFGSSSKAISKSLWNNNIGRYIKELEKQGHTDTSNQLSLLNQAIDKPDSVVSTKLRYAASLLALGGNVASGIANYAGVYMNLGPFLGAHGGVKHILVANGIAHKYLFRGKLQQADLVGKMTKDSFFKGYDEAEVKSTLNEMYASNLLFEQYNANMARLVNGNQIKDGIKIVEQVYMGIQAKTEQVAKTTAILSALKTGLDNGKKGNELHDFVKEAVFQTQGYYGKSGRPLAFQGPIGQMIYQFKKYPQTTIELMFLLGAHKNGENHTFKDKIPAAAMAVILGAIVGGGGLPFVSNISDIYDTIAKAAGFKSSDIKDDFRKAIKGFLGEEGGNLALHGLLSDSVIPGDFSSKLSMSSLLPATDLFDETNKDKVKSFASILGASGNNVLKFTNGINDIFKGDNRKAFFDAAPGVAKNLFQGIEAANTGEFRDARNQKITDATGKEAFLKGIGVTPKDLAGINRIQDEFYTKKANVENAKNIIYSKLARAELLNDPSQKEDARAIMSKWNEANPNNNIRVNLREVSQMVKRAKQESLDRDLKKTNKEYLNDFRDQATKLKNLN